ncbi:hypothetical protein SAMN05421771_1953 [Granulicella pectinivorans]|uniref:Uncharacterized protein n=1 Tax=Granulicella pectinivorans TaxID=474950 RepID=A0A1I6M6P1_9BACT|nr:hypothetical protein [Granulicella pectinivorans]SFS11366.1 hypothetical protein SAMN05421771_1953 [Granulicella pectinivorans]
MSTLQEYRCDVCGITSTNPTHWFVIQCGPTELKVQRWDTETANARGARHYCGEAHAQVYVSRWFEVLCAPAVRDFSGTTIPDSGTVGLE